MHLRTLPTRDDLLNTLAQIHADAKPKKLVNWASQIWPFVNEMQRDDIVVLPLKSQPSIYIGEITGDYQFDPNGPNRFQHWRPVRWIGEAIPREQFGKDLLYSFGAFMTICRIQRNNAEARIAAMRANGWQAEHFAVAPAGESLEATDAIEASEQGANLEELARDQIAQLITSRLTGHGLAWLVEAILNAQGYTTYRSPEGPDGGVDILAGTGPMGFGQPRLCVQVKSQDTPVDLAALNQLQGVMKNFNATEGLFVSWGGYKSSVLKQLPSAFFSVRLWTRKELLEALFQHYDSLDPDVKAEIPLKRIWTVAAPDEL